VRGRGRSGAAPPSLEREIDDLDALVDQAIKDVGAKLN